MKKNTESFPKKDTPSASEIRTKERILEKKPARLSRKLKKELDIKIVDNKTASQLERHIPRLAKVATTRAFHRALSSGNKVLIVEDGYLLEVSPDRTVRSIRAVAPSVKMRKGQVIEIK